MATSYTPILIRHAAALLERIFKEGHRYHKAGAILTGIRREGEAQMNLFYPQPPERSEDLMKVMDGINHTFGRGTLRFAAEGLQKPWQMRRRHLSPRYTTHWDEIPLVKAGGALRFILLTD